MSQEGGKGKGTVTEGRGDGQGADLGWLCQRDGCALDVYNTFIILALLASPLNASLQHCLIQIKNLCLSFRRQSQQPADHILILLCVALITEASVCEM